MKISCSIFLVLFGFSSHSEGILNGDLVQSKNLDKYKYLVSIYIDSHEVATAFTCEGGILNNRMILTAAHCFADWHKDHIDDHGKIIVTAHTLTSKEGAASEGSMKRKVERIYVPTEYFGAGFADIAILRLKKSLNILFNFHKLKSLTLPKKNFQTLGQEAVFAGYGANVSEKVGLEYRYTSDDQLRSMKVTVVPVPDVYTDPLTDQRFVMAEPIDNEKARGFCNGDSGAPLVIKTKKWAGLTRDYTVIGVASGNSDSCDDSISPGKYTKVTTYLDSFINKVLENPDISDPSIEVRYAALSC